MTTALEGGEWSAARPGRTLPPGKTQYPFYRRLGGPQGRSGWAENLVPTGIRSRTVQPVDSRYTDWATRPTTKICTWWKFQTETSLFSSYIITVISSYYNQHPSVQILNSCSPFALVDPTCDNTTPKLHPVIGCQLSQSRDQCSRVCI